MEPVPANTIGLTHVDSYDDMINSATLTDQLDAADVHYARAELPSIVGMGGSASTISYTSPKTGQPVTVLVVPHQYDVDRFSEDYYYFLGVTAADAAGLAWVEIYDRCLEIVRTA